LEDKTARFLDRLYAPIGQFIVEFENVCEAMRSAGIWAFQRDGLRNRKLAELTFAGLTASPLLEVFTSIISQSLTLGTEDKNRLSEIRKRTEQLITVRNRVIHSTWRFFDFADIEQGTPEGLLMSSRRTRHGLDTRMSSLTRKELQQLSEEAREVVKLIEDFISAAASLAAEPS